MSDTSFIPQADPRSAYLAQKVEIDAAIARVLERGWYILGEEVRAFEAEFAAFLDVGQAIGVASGTDAVELALRALKIGAGAAVYAPSHTAVATVAAIERAGARPILLDVDPATYTLTADILRDAVASRSALEGCRPAAVIAVHLYGMPAPMPSIISTSRQHGLKVIEDCAQAHGATLEGRSAGSWGDLAAFSFYPTKNLAALGDGGAVVTNDAGLAERVRMLREYGWRERYVSDVPGVNSRLDELQAAILRVKLAKLEEQNARRRQIAGRYSAGLASIDVTLPFVPDDVEHAFHQYVIRTQRRDALREFLANRKVGTAIHYPRPVHLQPAYQDRGLCAGQLSVTERIAGEILSLPIDHALRDEQVDRVIAAICEFGEGRHA